MAPHSGPSLVTSSCDVPLYLLSSEAGVFPCPLTCDDPMTGLALANRQYQMRHKQKPDKGICEEAWVTLLDHETRRPS